MDTLGTDLVVASHMGLHIVEQLHFKKMLHLQSIVVEENTN
jgi:hypothetical protein